jgi:hypothetical protein
MDLPPELVDYVFRCGCILSTSFCLALCQTSAWTRKLALPYLYSTIIIKNTQTARHIYRTVVEHPTDSLYPGLLLRNYIRSVYVDSDVFEMPMDIFRNCDRLSRLALGEEIFRLTVLFSSDHSGYSTSSIGISEHAILCKPDIHLLIFCISNPELSPSFRNSPLFFKVTHLRFGRMRSYSKCIDGYLAHFKRLTHIALPYQRPQVHILPDLLHVFDHLPMTFLVVVLLTDQLSEEERQDALRWVVDVHKSNYRVSVVLSQLGDLQTEWEEEARHGLSIWDKAAVFTQSLSS